VDGWECHAPSQIGTESGGFLGFPGLRMEASNAAPNGRADVYNYICVAFRTHIQLLSGSREVVFRMRHCGFDFILPLVNLNLCSSSKSRPSFPSVCHYISFSLPLNIKGFSASGQLFT